MLSPSGSVLLASVYSGTDPEELREFFASFACASLNHLTDLFICIDGPISDEILFIISSLESDSSFEMRVMSNANNLGLAISLNRMLIASLQLGYGIFYRADTDDLLHPHRLLRQYEFLVANPEVDICGTWYYIIPVCRAIRLPVNNSEIKKKFSSGLAIAHPTVAFKYSFVEKAGLYPTVLNSKTEDIHLWFNAFANDATFANIPLYLYSMRVDSGTVGRRSSLNLVLDVFLLRLRHISRHSLPFYCYFLSLLELAGRSVLFCLPVSLRLFIIRFYHAQWTGPS